MADDAERSDDWKALNELYWTHPDGHLTGLEPHQIDAILNAGFTARTPRVSEEYVEDEGRPRRHFAKFNLGESRPGIRANEQSVEDGEHG